MKSRLLLFILLLSGSILSAQESFIYAVRGADPLRLDLYRPAQPRADRAVVLYFHGGGFVEGTRADSLCSVSCQQLAQRGYTAISADYRLVSRNMRPDTVPVSHISIHAVRAIREATEDAAAAVAFLCQHAAEWDVDTSKLILTGSSAGAVTVLQLDYCRANRSDWARELPAGVRFAAVIPYAGAIYSLGKPQYLTAPSPTCFFHGTEDRIVTYNHLRMGKHNLTGSSDLAEKFLKEGYNYAIYRMENRYHDVAAFLPRTLEEFESFVALALSGRQVQQETTCHNIPGKIPEWARKSLLSLYKK